MFSPGALRESRRLPALAAIFRDHVPPTVKTILDFGGDRGGLFDGLVPGSSACVYDISGIQPANGIKAVRSLTNAPRIAST